MCALHEQRALTVLNAQRMKVNETNIAWLQGWKNGREEPVGEAIKVVMPAVSEDATFEITVKGLVAGNNDANRFSQFKIRR